MAKELDLSGVDEILAAKPAEPQNSENELDLSGVDEVLSPKQSILDKEIPFTPIFDPTLRDVGGAIKDTAVTVHDAALGATQGMLANSADEMAGGLGLGIEKLLGYIPGTAAHNTKQVDEKLKAEDFQLPEESAADIYKTYQKGSEAEFAKADERSPWAYGLGQVGGGIATSIAAGGALGINAASKGKSILDIAKADKLKAGIELLKRGGKNALLASPLMAVEGVTSSKGNLIGGNDAEQAQVGKDVVNNLAFGIPAVIGMQAITDVAAPAVKKGMDAVGKYTDEAIEGSPLARQAKKIYQYGKQGINPASEVHAEKLFAGEIGTSQKFMKEILDADEKLGKGVGQALQEAELTGLQLDINPVVDKSFKALSQSYDMLDDISQNSRGRMIFNNIANKTAKTVSPSEAKLLLDDVDSFIGKFKAAGNRTVTEQTILNNLMGFRKNLSNQLKTEIPKYGQAASRFEEFRRLVPETIISGKTPRDISEVYMGNLKNPEMKLFQKMEDLTTGATSTSQGGIPIKQAFGQMKTGMKEFEANDALRRAQDPTLQNPLARSSDEIATGIRDASDDAIGRRSLMSSEESRSIGSNVLTAGTGIGQASKSKFLYGLNLAGQAASSKPVKSVGNMSRKIYNYPNHKLDEAANQMLNTPGLKVLGQALKDGISSGDQAKKNAALFSIMQNPSASLFFNNEDDE